jgi:hypothetical protein
MTTAASQIRCVVLTPPGEGAEAAAHLAGRNWATIEVHDPLLAMVELCLRERAQRSRAGWGLQRIEQSALVVAHSERWPETESLVLAATRYLPLAEVYTLDAHGLTRRGQSAESPGTAIPSPADPCAPPAAEAVAEVRQRPASLAPRPIRPPVKTPPAAEAPRPGADSKNDSAGGPITRQEIDMLLESWNGEPER